MTERPEPKAADALEVRSLIAGDTDEVQEMMRSMSEVEREAPAGWAAWIG